MSLHDSQIKKTAILIVEDHDVFREFVHNKLHSLNSTFTIIEAQNAEEGLTLAKTTGPDIVITDIRLPKMRGLALTRRRKELPPRTIGTLLSISDGSVYKEQAITAGGYAYVRKQQFQSELISLLEKLLLDAAPIKVNEAAG